MKRLLVYLLFFFSYGLIFSSSSNASRVFCIKIYSENPEKKNLRNGWNYKQVVIYDDLSTIPLKAKCVESYGNWVEKDLKFNSRFYKSSGSDSITKSDYDLYEVKKNKWKTNRQVFKFFEKILGKSILVVSSPKRKIFELEEFKSMLPNDLKNDFFKSFEKIAKIKNGDIDNKIIVAKAEPSQTQEVASFNKCKLYRGEEKYFDNFKLDLKENKVFREFIAVDDTYNYTLEILKNNNKEIITSKKPYTDEKNLFVNYEFKKNSNDVFHVESKFNKETRRTKMICDKVFANWEAEPTVKPKKKVKIVKKKEPKQEEFKPKKTSQDNEAPVIEIAEALTVDSQAYTLKGKVKDKSQIYLTIDGRQVQVKKGNFELDRFSINSDATEEIKIVAIDKWNNRSEKIVKVTINLQSSSVAKVYEQLKPNNIKVKTDNNKIAIIIGIEKYENLTNLDAKYANRDAKAFRAYATRALGIKPSNIKMLIDDKATRSQALKAFKLWLPKIAGKGGKDIHIFFAGHGLASDNGEDLYILPQDGESSLLEDTAISRVELISLINKVNPKSVTMFFDTCYSGQTRDERMLVASLRPIRIVADEQETPNNFTIFTASNYDQTSGSIEEAEHGMFSYYLMKGLEGKADENKDRKITNGELISYLKDNVSQEAFTQNRQQDPMLAGDPDKILIKF